MAFLTVQPWHVLTLAGPQNKDFGLGLQTNLTGSLVLFVGQARSPQAFLLGKSHLYSGRYHKINA